MDSYSLRIFKWLYKYYWATT